MNETQDLFVFGSLMDAGSDSLRVTIGQIIAAAITYPDWVVTARAGLERVRGDAARLGQWDNIENLSYITAVVQEGFRWRPNIAEIGAPTTLTQDDEYEGYRFQRHCFYLECVAIALSPHEFEQPERFWPEMFLKDDVENAFKRHWAFGRGTKITPLASVGC